MNWLLISAAVIGLSWAKSSNHSTHIKYVGLSCNCGLRNSGKIVGGKETQKNEYPWIASLNNNCGGSIITPWHVLTAAHCTYGQTAEDITVGVGRYYKKDENNEYLKIHPVSRIIQHENYIHEMYINDISILFLASKISFNQYVGPICMPNQNIDLVGKYVKIVGWGMTKGTGSDKVLREVDVKVYDFQECRKIWEDIPKIKRQLCNEGHKKDSCFGDSGGPLVYLDPETNRFTQAALVSYGDSNCGATSKPSVNTDVFAYKDWINDAIIATQPEVHVCKKFKLPGSARFLKG